MRKRSTGEHADKNLMILATLFYTRTKQVLSSLVFTCRRWMDARFQQRLNSRLTFGAAPRSTARCQTQVP